MNKAEIFSQTSDAQIQLEESRRELDAFLYRASHDLKGPLARLEGMTQLMAVQAEGAELAMTIQLIESLTQEMNGVINELIHVQGLFNSKPIISEVKPENLFQEVISELSGRYPGVRLEVTIQNDQVWFTDRTLAQIIFRQLLGNAFAFQLKNEVGPLVDFRFYRKEEKVVIEVRDNGIGIENDQMDRIFELFYKGSSVSKGSGLGLYLVRKAVFQLNGKIQVESEPSQYSLFRIILPQQTKKN